MAHNNSRLRSYNDSTRDSMDSRVTKNYDSASQKEVTRLVDKFAKDVQISPETVKIAQKMMSANAV